MKQHQAVAIVQGRKSSHDGNLKAANQLLQKANSFAGIIRTFHPFKDGEVALPPEKTRVQSTVADVIQSVRASAVAMFDIVLVQDVGNLTAKADLEMTLDGRSINLKGVPATYLLFLGHQAQDFITFIKNIPVLDDAVEWTFDEQNGTWVSEPEETERTAKEVVPITKAPATDKFPAQVEMVPRDVRTMKVRAVRQSGAIPKAEKEKLLARAIAFAEKIKQTREEANLVEVEQKKAGEQIFDLVFGDLKFNR